MSDLYDLIRATAAEYDTDSPSVLAAFVAAATPIEDIERFYVVALTSLVQDVWRSDRNNAVNAQQRGPSISKKAERVRNEWQRFLNSRLATPDGWKQMSVCTIDDLLAAIDARVDHISAVQQQIAYYERVVTAMKAEGVETVGELKGSVQ